MTKNIDNSIIKYITDNGKATCGQIAQNLGVNRSTVLRHLKSLIQFKEIKIIDFKYYTTKTSSASLDTSQRLELSKDSQYQAMRTLCLETLVELGDADLSKKFREVDKANDLHSLSDIENELVPQRQKGRTMLTFVARYLLYRIARYKSGLLK